MTSTPSIPPTRSDEELRASEAKFAGILAIAADAIVTIDESHRIIHFNQGAEEIFGYRAAEIIGQPLSILLPERFRATHDAHVDAFGQSAETARRMGHRREVSGRRRDGTEFPAEASIAKLDTPDGGRMSGPTFVCSSQSEPTRKLSTASQSVARNRASWYTSLSKTSSDVAEHFCPLWLNALCSTFLIAWSRSDSAVTTVARSALSA